MNTLQRVLLWVLSVALLLAIPTGLAAASQVDGKQDRAHHEADTDPVSHKEPQAEEKSEPAGIFDTALKIKGTGISLQFGGYVKVDYIQDLDPSGNEKEFQVRTIPVVPTDPKFGLGGTTNLQASQSRFSIDVRAATSMGQVRGFIEGDFFGGGGSLRLRHGYGEWKGILGGQTWTTFMDESARPHTVDFEGPDAGYFARQPMIRYTGKPSKKFEWSVAAEDARVNETFVAPGISASSRNTLPDLVGRVRFEPKWGHIQFAGVARQLRVVSDSGTVDDTTMGYGLGLSGKSKVAKRDAIMGLIGVGSGAAHYVSSFTGTNSNAVLTPAGNLESIDYFALMFGYLHRWNKKLSSSIGLGYAELDNKPSQPDDAIKSTRSPHLNLIYTHNRLLEIGGEVMWGQRENKNGDTGDATRLQFAVTYKFR